MKKILPYILIIAASYLVVAFALNQINFTTWNIGERVLVIVFGFLGVWIYIGIQRFKN
jgi:urocanate hydratase